MQQIPKNLVMFDYDGVIADSYQVFTTAFLEASQKSGFHEMDSKTNIMRLFDGNLFESLKAYALGDKMINQILRRFQVLVSPNIEKVKLFDGMADTLETVSETNKVYIITSNLSRVVHRALEVESVNGVEGVIGAETDRSKVNKIKKVMSRYSNLRAFYVGDTKGDMLEGQRAGATTVAVTWGWHAEKKLQEGFPDYVIHSQDELVTLLC